MIYLRMPQQLLHISAQFSICGAALFASSISVDKSRAAPCASGAALIASSSSGAPKYMAIAIVTVIAIVMVIVDAIGDSDSNSI